MIIGEPTNQFDGYEEDNYDYLFKRKGGAPTSHQQKKIEKRAAKGKPPGRLMQKRLDRQAGITPKKRLIMGNFGLFNKNKNQEAASQDAAAQTDTNQLQDAAPVEDTAQNPEMNAGAENNTPSSDPQPSTDAAPENSGNDALPESSYDDYDDYDDAANTKSESKSTDKDNAKKGGMGVWVGWAFLGFTVVVIGYTMYRLDKMEAKLVPNDRLHHPNY